MINIYNLLKKHFIRIHKQPKITTLQVIEANEKIKESAISKKSYTSSLTAEQINKLFSDAFTLINNKEKEKFDILSKRVENLMIKVNKSIQNDKINKEKSIININRLYEKALKKFEKDNEIN